ncbi:MAG: MerR family transcriptional regulator [Lachnospiraceae bacterium]|nr:MerR family transcriptional regulator [Lachnospiraceae bacterium]
MTIKQLEQQLEIPRATIRFYEKENLISPIRKDNSYREYSEEDVAILKKIIILRKIGLSISDIKKVLEGDCSLQSLLEKNISELENQIKELEGAINVSKIMQERNEDIFNLDENKYWTEIDNLEKSGLKFKDIINDVIEFEKGVIFDEFMLRNSEGKLIYGWKESIIRAIAACIFCGVLWYVLEGDNKTYKDFLEGFFWPFICIVFSSIIGLPVYFIGKKNPKLAQIIKKIGWIIGGVFVVGLLILAFVLSL